MVNTLETVLNGRFVLILFNGLLCFADSTDFEQQVYQKKDDCPYSHDHEIGENKQPIGRLVTGSK